MALIVFGCFVLYIIIAILFLKWRSREVKKDDPKRRRKLIMAWLLVILLPTWDVALACIIQFPCCWFWGGEKVYAPIETDTIFYNLGRNKWGLSQWTYKPYFRNGLRYIEMNVTELLANSQLPNNGIYRFWVNNGKLEFEEIKKIESRYEITDNLFEMPVIPLSFYQERIIDRKDGSIKAYARIVSSGYLGLGFVPFFNWLKWDEHFVSGIRFCPIHYEDIIQKAINSPLQE